jgi:predicted dehydrogenase
MPARRTARKVRYAVVGLGHFAQSAILPAFRHAYNSALTAIVSGDAVKRAALKTRYRVHHALSYEDFDDFLKTGEVDAVYLALPNHLHKDFTLRAAAQHVHVLCEKPMAVDVAQCREMIDACARADVKLMTAYRLHFEGSNLTSLDAVREGRIGEPRLFSSTFTMQLKPPNVRSKPVPGSGPLYDLGTYCINTARGLFGSEPIEVFAASAGAKGHVPRGDDQTTAVLRFPGGRLAIFAVSFEAFHDSRYEVIGTKGVLSAHPAYQHRGALRLTLEADGKKRTTTFAARDQVAAELLAFSDCIATGREPEPSGEEGLLDVRVIEALIESSRKGAPVKLSAAHPKKGRPGRRQERKLPPVEQEPPLIHVAPPHP